LFTGRPAAGIQRPASGLKIDVQSNQTGDFAGVAEQLAKQSRDVQVTTTRQRRNG
jgi:hypothetical protein